jgi:hypothetical protein
MDEVGGEDHEGKTCRNTLCQFSKTLARKESRNSFEPGVGDGFAMDDGFIHLMLILETELTDQRHDEETHENEAQQVIV